jgi:hypothetical protein
MWWAQKMGWDLIDEPSPRETPAFEHEASALN